MSALSAQEFVHIEVPAGFTLEAGTKGIAVADYDLDYDLDVFVVVKTPFDSGEGDSWSRLYRNNGNGTYTDVTPTSGLGTGSTDFGQKTGASWGDFDNDGYPDLMLTCYYGVQLFRNRGDGTFSDLTDTAGITAAWPCNFYSGFWWDYNRDGMLDMFLSGHNTCTGNSVYRNEGGGVFQNVTDSLGLEIEGLAYMSIPLDVNGDGWTDVYTAVDYGINQLFVSDSGRKFVEQASLYKLNDDGNDMGLATGDDNLDGMIDIHCTDININSLFRKQEDGTYRDRAGEAGVLDTDWAWETRFADFDNDGAEDLFVVNGYEGEPYRNTYFSNRAASGEEGFSDRSDETGLGEAYLSECFEVFDYDNDGDLDVLLSTEPESLSPVFYDNTVISDTVLPGSHWVKVFLSGRESNRCGFGSLLEIRNGGKRQIRSYHGVGLYSQSHQPVHFGLDTVTRIDSLLIHWPSGQTDTLTGLDANTTYLVVEKIRYTTIDAPIDKRRGCMDPNSCSYDPEATVHDPELCSYLPGGQITGNHQVGMLARETYTFSGVESPEVIWTVENGMILDGQGTREIEIQWGIAEAGSVSARQVAECHGETVTLPVEISLERISPGHSLARVWNEALLEAIREDYARPTVHARNLFHAAVAMYDSWALYDGEARPFLIGNRVGEFHSDFEGFTPAEAPEEALKKTLSYAAYRLMNHRFSASPGSAHTLDRFRMIMEQMGYDTTFTSTDYSLGDPAALGNYIAETLIEFGLQDGARESTGYDNAIYKPVNPPLAPTERGNSSLVDPNRWQPLALETFIDQSGNLIEGSTPEFLSPEWGWVVPFSLTEADVTTWNEYPVYLDPGPPPCLDNEEGREDYQWGFALVSIWGSHLDPGDGVMWDISPGAMGNVDPGQFPESFEKYPDFFRPEGGDIGTGRPLNPVTGEPYEPQLVPRGDYTRVLAEFWADGPDSETPPGHWFTLLNYVNDHPLMEKRFGGRGEILDPLEWDVKAYFTLGGTMHDAAIAAWSVKGAYDYIRPISAIRYMARLGQSTDTSLTNYHPQGIPLTEGYIEVIREDDPLAGDSGRYVGEIKVRSWKGHTYVEDPETDQAGVGWIPAAEWWPYQRPSFVTPPFAGYVSGHSTYSRAAAEVLTLLTGDPYFPGGYGEFVAPRNEFLVFEEGPSEDVRLRWATYRDASDQCSLSRIWGGIHPPMDDIPGRLIGEEIGTRAFALAREYFGVPSPVSSPYAGSAGRIYPNPARSGQYIHVQGTLPGERFVLTDIQGKGYPLQVRSHGRWNGITVLDLPRLPAGLYLLRSDSGTRRLLVTSDGTFR